MLKSLRSVWLLTNCSHKRLIAGEDSRLETLYDVYAWYQIMMFMIGSAAPELGTLWSDRTEDTFVQKSFAFCGEGDFLPMSQYKRLSFKFISFKGFVDMASQC